MEFQGFKELPRLGSLPSEAPPLTNCEMLHKPPATFQIHGHTQYLHVSAGLDSLSPNWQSTMQHWLRENDASSPMHTDSKSSGSLIWVPDMASTSPGVAAPARQLRKRSRDGERACWSAKHAPQQNMDKPSGHAHQNSLSPPPSHPFGQVRRTTSIRTTPRTLRLPSST
jgi:hypothetical protein